MHSCDGLCIVIGRRGPVYISQVFSELYLRGTINVSQIVAEAYQARDQHDTQQSFHDIEELRVLVGRGLGLLRTRAGASDRNGCAGLVFLVLCDDLRRDQ